MSTSPLPSPSEARFEVRALDTARLLRALSWSELADAALLSRAAISKIRNGAVPAVDTVSALAEALNFPRAHFFNAQAPTPAASVLHYRKKARAPKKRISQLMASATTLNALVGYLAAQPGFPQSAIPHLSNHDIELAAQACREAWGIEPAAPIDHACAAIERAGAITATFDADDIAVDGFSWYHAAASGRRGQQHQIPLIMFSRMSAPSRVRFSLLHEAGHLALHRNPGHSNLPGESSCDNNEQKEREANRFAAAMLLPQAPFREQFPFHNDRLDWDALLTLKQHWGASLQAIIFRARELEIIGAATYRWAFVHINQRGWKRDEPGEPAEAESPQALSELIDSQLKRTGTDLVEFANQLALPVDIIKHLMTP